jgi:hypothetical protein
MPASSSVNSVLSVKRSHLRNLRSKTYQGSDHEFEEILTSVLGQRSSAIHPGAGVHTGLEVGASIRGSGDENKEVVITVRKRIDSITVGLCIGVNPSHVAILNLHVHSNEWPPSLSLRMTIRLLNFLNGLA